MWGWVIDDVKGVGSGVVGGKGDGEGVGDVCEVFGWGDGGKGCGGNVV